MRFGSRPVGAQGDLTVQRTRTELEVKPIALGYGVLLVAAMLLFVSQAQAAAPIGTRAAVQGVVRDASGVAQMGALVQVLAANSTTVGTSFTDLHGHYLIANLLPGKYKVQASATLFVPAIKDNLQLHNGGRTVVNLTLATLFETTNWLPSNRRRPDEPADDWKWTLRSTANRPILRVLDDGETVIVSPGEGEGSARRPVQARAEVECGSGGFGTGGTRTTLTANREGRNGSDVLMQASLGDGHGASTSMTAGYQQRMGFATARTIVRYQSHPEIVGADGSGLQTFEVRSGQQTQLGDQVELEVGGVIRAAHNAGYAMQASPFLRLTAHPTGTWMVQYRLAGTREVQGIADLDTADDDIPVAIVSNGRLRLEQGRHQQLAVAHKVGRGSVEVTVYHDALNNVPVSGGGFGSPQSGIATDGLLVDGMTGAFRTLAAGYTANGASLALDTTLMPGLMGAVEYSLGDALTSERALTSSPASAAAQMKAHSSQAATLSLRGKLGEATVRASYRWQPLRTVTAVNPYGDGSDRGYLSFTVRQPLHWKNRLPAGLDARIDVTNLLAQGYRPFLSADGQTLYFAQTPRTIQAGLSLSF
jgi:hypothetical protein